MIFYEPGVIALCWDQLRECALLYDLIAYPESLNCHYLHQFFFTILGLATKSKNPST